MLEFVAFNAISKSTSTGEYNLMIALMASLDPKTNANIPKIQIIMFLNMI